MKNNVTRREHALVPVASETSASDIPNKLYFPIREAAKLIGVEPYVLRFWEKEFPTFHPTKGGSGHRRYRKKDIETGFEIKRLLYQQGFTIEGARNQLKNAKRAASPASAPRQKQPALPFAEFSDATLGRIRSELNEILAILAPPRR